MILLFIKIQMWRLYKFEEIILKYIFVCPLKIIEYFENKNPPSSNNMNIVFIFMYLIKKKQKSNMQIIT